MYKVFDLKIVGTTPCVFCLLDVFWIFGQQNQCFVSKASKLYSQVNLRFNYTTYYLNSSLEVEASCPQADPGASSWRWICQSRRTTRRCALAVIEVKHKFGSTGCRQRGWFSWQWLVASFFLSNILVPKLNSSVGKLWKLNKGQVEEGLPPFTALQLSGKGFDSCTTSYLLHWRPASGAS